MLEKILRSGDKVEVRKLLSVGTDNDDGKYYISSITDIFDDTRIGITMPIERGGLVPLDVGEKYKLCFYSSNGLYQSKGIVQERYKSEHLYIAVVKFTANMEKLQRRQFFRIDCLIDLTYRTIAGIPNPGEPPVNPGEWKKATAIDISGGGIRFNNKDLHPEEKFYEIRFNIAIDGSLKEIATYARVVFISDIPNRTGLYEYRIEFISINAKDRETIVRYVFDEDRKRRKKDLK